MGDGLLGRGDGCANVVLECGSYLCVNRVEFFVRHRDDGQVITHLGHENGLGLCSDTL